MNGLTAVSFGATLTWLQITKFYIQLGTGATTTAVGNVTLNSVSGLGAELSRITAGHSYARYSRLHLHPTPTQVNTYYADVVLHVEDLANADDEPFLPEDFHYLLKVGAKRKEYDKREK